jgi:hypothetical protein
MLSEQAIKKFQEIYFKEYGEALDFNEAAARAESFLRFFKTIVKPSTQKGACHASKDHSSTTAQ